MLPSEQRLYFPLKKYAELLLSNYKAIADIAEKKGSTSLSLTFLKKHFALKDSIYTSDKMKQIEEMNAKYQTEKNEVSLKPCINRAFGQRVAFALQINKRTRSKKCERQYAPVFE